MPAARLVELRVLDGPNLYFTRPAVKLTLAVPGWLALSEARAAGAATAARGDWGGGSPRASSDSTASGERTPHARKASGPLSPGAPGSDRRRRFVSLLAAHLLRRLARAQGIRVAVRWRAGALPDEFVIAFPWRRRGIAEATGTALVRLLDRAASGRADVEGLVARLAAEASRTDPGPRPSVPVPRIPVIAVTGTNGKTTVTRLLSHLGRAAGLTTAHACTDGVYLNDELVEEGDYSGYGGAGLALSQPGVQLAITETARGGILLRGIGTAHNDVSVVTNVSADHLGLHGIETLDQLAEVKAAIVRITRPDGWTVLNADDPRVISMRRLSPARPFAFALSADNPWVRASLDEGGRAMTVVDGEIAMLQDSRVHTLVPVEDVPMTIAGVSSINVANALAATAAAIGVGLPREAIVRGLKTFVLDPERNPGRMNLWELDGRVVVIDYAHNEAGLTGLIEVCRGLRPPGGEIWLTIATAGDRAPDIVTGMGYLAGRGSDHVGVAELLRYLRGRDRDELIALMRDGALDGGADAVSVYPDELAALRRTLRASRHGDVVAVTALGMRPQVFAWLARRGAARLTPARVRALARRARRPATSRPASLARSAR